MEPVRPSFEGVYRSCYEPIYHYIVPRVDSIQTAEDITQNVFVSAWRRWPSYDPCTSSVKTWLYCIAKNALISHYRSQRPTVSLEALAESGASEPFIDNVRVAETLLAQRAALAKAFEVLPAQQRRIVVLRYFGGRSSREVAAELGLSDSCVRMSLSRSLQKLYEILEADGFQWEDLNL